MLDERRPSPVRAVAADADLIDPRLLMGEAKTMLYLGEAVDRTIKRSYHLKPMTRNKSNDKAISKSNGSVDGSGSVGNRSGSDIKSMDLSADMAEGSKTLEEESSTSQAGSMSASATSAPTFNFEGITFPLLDCEKFVGSCWKSFHDHAAEPFDHMDACQLALPQLRIKNAVHQLSHRVTEEQIEEYCTYFKLSPYSCLSWVQYKEFCSALFTPLLRNKMVECGVPIKQFTNMKSSRKKQGSLSGPSLLQNGNDGDMYHVSERNPSRLHDDGHPYGQMIRHHRYTSCVDKESIGMPHAEIEYSSSCVEIPRSRQGEQPKPRIIQQQSMNLKVPVGMLHDSIVDQFKQLSRQHRRKDLPPIGKMKSHARLAAEHEAAIESARDGPSDASQDNASDTAAAAAAGAGNVSSAALEGINAAAEKRRRSTVVLNRFQLHEQQRMQVKLERKAAAAAKKKAEAAMEKDIHDVFTANPLTDMPSYCKPLMKQKVYELTHRGDSYFHRWDHMREIRDQRFEQKERKENMQKMIHALQKTVINSDRMEQDAARSTLEMVKLQERDYLHHKNKYNEDMSSWRRSVYNRQETLRKEVAARDLRRAMSEALSVVHDDKEREKHEKRLNKPQSSIARLSEHSTYKVNVPSELLAKVKDAKRYSEYTAARADAQAYVDHTMSERIHRYAEARALALSRAASSGAPVSVNTIYGDMIFNADSESALAGVAATTSLAYSSTLSMVGDSYHPPYIHTSGQHSRGQQRFGNGGSAPGSPGGGRYSPNESNTFLKELAEKEYLARKQVYGDDELDAGSYFNEEYDDHGAGLAAGGAAVGGEGFGRAFSNNVAPMGDDDGSDTSWRTDPRLAEMDL